MQALSDFDTVRFESYLMDGDRAVWPKLPLIRSLCEIELALDRISTELGEVLALERANTHATLANAANNGNGLQPKARMPSYASLANLGSVSTLDAFDDTGGSTSIRQKIPSSHSTGVLPSRREPITGGSMLAGGKGHHRTGSSGSRPDGLSPPTPTRGRHSDSVSSACGNMPAVASHASLLSLGIAPVDVDDHEWSTYAT